MRGPPLSSFIALWQKASKSYTNHSRKFNARRSIRGRFIQVIAEGNIEIGEEITISYSKGYFYPSDEVLRNNEEEEEIIEARLERYWNLWPIRS